MKGYKPFGVVGTVHALLPALHAWILPSFAHLQAAEVRRWNMSVRQSSRPPPRCDACNLDLARQWHDWAEQAERQAGKGLPLSAA
jgi:hypothetical protein